MSFDLNIIKNLNKEEQNEILEYLQNGRKHERYENNLKAIEDNKKYVGKCFKSKLKDKYIMVIDARSTNEYHLECFTFSYPITFLQTHPFMTKLFNDNSCFGNVELEGFDVEDIGLLCFSLKASGKRIDSEFEEITKEEFFEEFDKWTNNFKEELKKFADSKK